MPRKNARLIVRSNLLRRIDRWLDISLGIVIGPAGYDQPPLSGPG